MVDTLFPTTVYHVDLEPTDEVHDGMVKYIDRFYDKNIHNLGRVPSLTGEILGDSQIASEKEFYWISKQVSIHVEKYIELLGATLQPTDIHPGSDIYTPQSWPIVCTNGGGVGYHNHCQSHLSAVFYVRTEEGNDTGQLVVHSPEPNTLSGLPIFHIKNTEYNTRTKYYPAVQNRLIIFPSTLNHEVREYRGITNRYSISYDILITTRKDAGNFCLVNPSRWVKINE
jgi:uncharacterized protein (TIGR02466 family)